jgi:hypothetical protein
MPLDFSTPPLPQGVRDIEEWRRFLYRSINCFYQAAAVESVTIGQHTEAWGISCILGTSHTGYTFVLVDYRRQFRTAERSSIYRDPKR